MSFPEWIADPLSGAAVLAAVAFGLVLSLVALESRALAGGMARAFAVCRVFAAASGLALVGGASHLAVILIGVELSGGIPWRAAQGPSDGPIGLSRRRLRLRGVACLLLIAGAVALGTSSGTSSLHPAGTIPAERDASHGATVGSASASPSRWTTFGAALVLSGLALRMLASPFPTAICGGEDQSDVDWGIALVIGRTAAVVAWARLLILTPAYRTDAAGTGAAVLAALTLFAALGRLSHRDRWRSFLRGQAVAQSGFVLLALAAASAEAANPAGSEPSAALGGLAAAIGLSIIDGLATVAIVAALAALSTTSRGQASYLQDGSRHVDELAGLVRADLPAAVALGTLVLALAGAPFMAGCWLRWLILSAAGSVHLDLPADDPPLPHPVLFAVSILACVTWTASLLSALRVLSVLLFAMPRRAARVTGGTACLLAATLTAVLLAGTGLLPGPLIDALRPLRSASPQPLPQSPAGRGKSPLSSIPGSRWRQGLACGRLVP